MKQRWARDGVPCAIVACPPPMGIFDMRNTMLLAASAPFAIAAASLLPSAAQAQNVVCKTTANADAGTIAPGKDSDVVCGNGASITGDGSVAIGAETTAATR